MDDRHKYDYEIEPGSAPDRCIRFVGSNRRVLEIGSGPGAITRWLSKNGCRVTALEIDAEAIEIVRKHCAQVFQCDLNDDRWASGLPELGTFDVILAADVFEHLYRPQTCLEQLHRFVSPHGSLVVSVPHVGHAAIQACLVNSDFQYNPWGLLDSTHIRFFGLTNIQELFEGAGFKIIEANFIVTHPRDTELSNQWDRVPYRVQRAVLSGKYSCVYQVVLRAVPADRPERALELTTVPIPMANGTSLPSRISQNPLGGALAGLVPGTVRARISSIFKKLGI